MRIWTLILVGVVICHAGFCLAGSIRGTAYDADGRVVPEARVLLMADYVKQQEQRTGQSGGFRFDNVSPGRYEVQIKKEKTFIFQNTVILEKVDQEIVIYAVLPIARMMDVSGVSATLPEGVSKFVPASSSPEAGGQVALAQPLERARVAYPREAIAQGIEGKVAVHARINVDGKVSDGLVLSSPHELLTRAALDSLAKARYRPMHLNGHPVACGIDILIEFTLSPAPPPSSTSEKAPR